MFTFAVPTRRSALPGCLLLALESGGLRSLGCCHLLPSSTDTPVQVYLLLGCSAQEQFVRRFQGCSAHFLPKILLIINCPRISPVLVLSYLGLITAASRQVQMCGQGEAALFDCRIVTMSTSSVAKPPTLHPNNFISPSSCHTSKTGQQIVFR